MTDLNKTTSDRVKIAERKQAKRVLEQYRLPHEIDAQIIDGQLTIRGDCSFAVRHDSSEGSCREPVDIEHYLADLARVTDPDSFPWKVTSILQGQFDLHPSRALYTVTRETIQLRRNDGSITTWSVNECGLKE